MTDARALDTIASSGLEWLDDAECANLDDACAAEGKSALGFFFVNAGHVIGAEALDICRRQCPVRRECVIHAYTGLPGGLPIAGGYMGGFSLGQRKDMTLAQALELVEADEAGELEVAVDLAELTEFVEASESAELDPTG